MMRAAYNFVLPSMVVMSACAASATMTMEADRFRNVQTGYQVQYVGNEPEEGMGDAWRLDNYRYVESKTIPGGQWKPREEERYVVERHYDVDDDGVTDLKRKTPVYDLRFTHRRTDGVVWLRSIPLGVRLKSKELRVLAERYLDGVSGGSSVLVRFGEEGAWGSLEKRRAVKKVAAGACRVAGAPAFAFDMEIVDVDRVRAGDAEVSEVSRVVLIDAGYTTTVENLPKTKKGVYKVLILAGYSNKPQDFEALAPEFTAFLERIRFRGSERGTDCAAVLAAGVETEREDSVDREVPAAESASTDVSAVPTEATEPTQQQAGSAPSPSGSIAPAAPTARPAEE